MIKKILRRIRGIFRRGGGLFFPLDRTLPLPEGVSAEQLYNFVTSVRVHDAPESEMVAYATHDFKRFVYTWDMVRGLDGRCLELGANPYFTTMLLKQFSDLELHLANYFGGDDRGIHRQQVFYESLAGSEIVSENLEFQHFNVETDSFPYEENYFDVVIFAEIIEHLVNDPCSVLREIARVLKPGGTLILTTPNVARLENVARLISGENIYDPYSGYGPYGRHNREYNINELSRLLKFEGFEPLNFFTSDVHANKAHDFCDLRRLEDLIKFRADDLGQYIFSAHKLIERLDHSPDQRPNWLYRSYPDGQLI